MVLHAKLQIILTKKVGKNECGQNRLLKKL